MPARTGDAPKTAVSAAVVQRASALTVQARDCTVASVEASRALVLFVVGPRLFVTAHAELLPFTHAAGEHVSELEQTSPVKRFVPM